MKKVFFVLVFIFSILCTAQAGYIIRSLPSAGIIPSSLVNYTLTFDGADNPIAATASFIPGVQGIAIVYANATMARIFNVPSTEPIEVRDFHYLEHDERYILCGSRGTGASARAFVATIDATFSLMQFMEYPEASIFYSIWGNDDPALGFYVCGAKDSYGVIASVHRSNLYLTSLYRINHWEYHKIIRQENSLRFVVSGRDPECTRIGYTEFTPPAAPLTNNYWAQNTESASLCVVSDNMLTSNQVILASSWQNTVTLSLVNFGVGVAPSSYRFTLSSAIDRYYVQDISTIVENNNIRISVAGYKIPSLAPSPREAWYGYVMGLSATSVMRNNSYYGSTTDRYEHYKVKDHNGVTYTGGFFQNPNIGGVLFGTPRTNAPFCDHTYQASNNIIGYQPSSMPVYIADFSPHILSPYPSHESQTYSTECSPFKGEEPDLKSAMSAENESEITTFYDRIVVKDIPANTGYQIYNTLGQLISTGVTTPDISTASLGKGVYILRLESGKTFKFVK